MTGPRRVVRATPTFFEDVDHQLGAERGPRGEPSVHDFQVFELLRSVEIFATRFDELSQLIPGRPEYRILIVAGVLVSRPSVVGQLAPDGAVELVELELDVEHGS